MVSYIDPKRKEHFEQIKVKKRRADKINQSCFAIICAMIIWTGIIFLLGIFTDRDSLLYAILMLFCIISALLGSLKRNLYLSIAALVLYIAGTVINQTYTESLYLLEICLIPLPICGTIYANVIENQLRQEEGYPQFDLSLEEQALQEKVAQQTSYAALNRQKNAESALDTMKDPASEPPAEKPSAAPIDMDYI